MTAVPGSQPEFDPELTPLGDPALGNVVPLRPASERAVHRQYLESGMGDPVAVTAPKQQNPAPIFGSATLQLPQWPIALVLSGMLVGLAVIAFDSVRLGVIVFGAGMLLAFFLRLVLNDRDAGMLKVRNRVVDLFVLGSFAAALLVFALWVPAPN